VLPTPEQTIVNNLPPTEVVNNFTVEQPAVNVAAPIVNMPEVTNNIVNNVPPAEVSVSLKDRKTETTVTYDSKGNIASTTQLESDA